MAQEIKAYSLEGLKKLMADLGLPKFRAKQVIQWLYQKGATSYDQMTNLPKALREKLQEEAPLYAPEIIDKQVSKDGTRKYVVQFHDGASAEMVAIPAKDRLTVCFSTQVGCAMACSFCATGKEGFTRDLLPGEIVDQVMIAQKDMDARVSNLVGMGQGEPFLNYENVLAALRILNGPDGLNIGARHIAVSTCGIFPGISRFGEEPEQFTLAISLHSAIQETRDRIMPKVKKQPLKDLKKVIKDYQANSGRRVTFEYLMADTFNDDEEHLKALVSFCKGMLCHVNLIPLNKVDGSPLQPSKHARVRRFLDELNANGVEATLRESRGSDISGACGQLKNKKA